MRSGLDDLFGLNTFAASPKPFAFFDRDTVLIFISDEFKVSFGLFAVC